MIYSLAIRLLNGSVRAIMLLAITGGQNQCSILTKKKFGAFVAALRKEKGITQKELSEQLCISDKAVSKWETGVSLPDTVLLIPLANLLDVSVTELLMCERLPNNDVLKPDKVEDIVKTAITYAD